MRKILDLVGERFGRLVVLHKDPNKKRYWICKCDCGKIISAFSGNLLSRLTKSCGCLNSELASQRRLIDLTGKTFGRLTVLRRADENANNGNPRWICKCSCKDKSIVKVSGWNLTRGHTQSCGCLARELVSARRRKWMTPDEERLSDIYNAMHQRCYDKNNKKLGKSIER